MQYKGIKSINTAKGREMLNVSPRDQTVEQWLDEYASTGLKAHFETGFKDPLEEEDMKWKETGSSIEFDPAPMGMHIARCIRIIDLGTTVDTMYQKEKHNVFLMWELPSEMHTYTIKGKDNEADKEITEPFTVGKFYNMSLSDGSHLRNDLQSWRGRAFTPVELEGFDPKAVVGAPCMINIVHKPKKAPKTGVNAEVVSVTPMVKGMECPAQVHPTVYFSLDIEDFDPQVLENMSSGLKAKVLQSNEYREIMAAVQQHQETQNAQAQQPTQGTQQSENPAPVDDGFDDIPF